LFYSFIYVPDQYDLGVSQTFDIFINNIIKLINHGPKYAGCNQYKLIHKYIL